MGIGYLIQFFPLMELALYEEGIAHGDVMSIRICFSSSSLAQRRQRLLCFHFTSGENERFEGPVSLADIHKNRKGLWDCNEDCSVISLLKYKSVWWTTPAPPEGNMSNLSALQF